MRGDLPELTVVPAVPDDRTVIVGILEGAQRWLAAKGIGQWILPFSAEWIDPEIAADEFWVVRLRGNPVAMFRLLWSDPFFWGERDDGSAAFVHTLTVRRDHAGQGIGRGPRGGVFFGWTASPIIERSASTTNGRGSSRSARLRSGTRR